MTRREEKEKVLGRSKPEETVDARYEEPGPAPEPAPAADNPIDQLIDALLGSFAASGVPKYEFNDTETGAILTVQLQGYESKNVAVTVQGDVVQVVATRELPAAAEGQEAGDVEESVLTFGLRTYVDGDKTAAQFKDGVLTVTLVKMESDPSQPRTIEIS